MTPIQERLSALKKRLTPGNIQIGPIEDRNTAGLRELTEIVEQLAGHVEQSETKADRPDANERTATRPLPTQNTSTRKGSAP